MNGHNRYPAELDGLVKMSNRYGGDARFVLAGGGNSSWKNDGALYVKSSGMSLADINAGGFVGMDRARLRALMIKDYNRDDDAKREAEVLADMAVSRLSGYNALRPSVETLLHDLFPYAYVLHLHPALVNGMTCGARGREIASDLFGDDAIWIPEYKPGYELAKLCANKIDIFTKTRGAAPKTIFLQNHGVFVAADTIAEIDAIYDEIMDKFESRAIIKPAGSFEITSFACELAGNARIGAPNPATPSAGCSPAPRLLRALPSPPRVILQISGADVAALIKDEPSRRALDGAFTPDHIVYCKPRFLFYGGGPAQNAEALFSRAYAAFVQENRYAPRIICFCGDNTGDGAAYACAENEREAENAAALFIDAVKIAVYSANFGGPRHMSRGLVDFIANWEIETYRSKVAQK